MFLLIIFQSLFLGQSPNSLVWPKQPFKICLMFFSLVLPLELCRGTQLFIQRSFCLALILPYLITSPLTFFIPTCMLSLWNLLLCHSDFYSSLPFPGWASPTQSLPGWTKWHSFGFHVQPATHYHKTNPPSSLSVYDPRQ